MNRIVPSQIVAFVDTVFPWAAARLDVALTGGPEQVTLRTLLRMLDRVPPHLVALNGRDLVWLMVFQDYVQRGLEEWDQRRPFTLHTLPEGGPKAIEFVRDAFAGLPDDTPAPDTTGLEFLDEDLRQALRGDLGSVNRALSAAEWKAATVLAGSVVEALLLWALQRREIAEVRTAAAEARAAGRFTKLPDNNLLRWDAVQFNEVAHHMDIISDDAHAQATLCRTYRNLIHPGRVQRTSMVCDRGTALSAAAAVEIVARDLAAERVKDQSGAVGQ